MPNGVITEMDRYILQSLCALQQRLDRIARGDPRVFPPRDLVSALLDLPANRIPVVLPAGSSAVVQWAQVPQRQRGIVKRVGVLLTAGTLSDLRVSTRINGNKVQPLLDVVGVIGGIPFQEMCEVDLDLSANEQFDLLLENTGLNPVTVAARTWGWFWVVEGD